MGPVGGFGSRSIHSSDKTKLSASSVHCFGPASGRGTRETCWNGEEHRVERQARSDRSAIESAHERGQANSSRQGCWTRFHAPTGAAGDTPQHQCAIPDLHSLEDFDHGSFLGFSARLQIFREV
jgi:hypothetical protein